MPVENEGKQKYSEAMFSFMTTEHFMLQSARGIINQEINSRVSKYFFNPVERLNRLPFSGPVAGRSRAFRTFLHHCFFRPVVCG